MYKRQEVSFNTALLEIEDILNVHNLSCQELGLPVPTYPQRSDEANAIDPIEQEFLFCEHYETANIEPVSYTHLDVYKRQISNLVLRTACLQLVEVNV